MLDPRNLTNKGEQNKDMELQGKGELEGLQRKQEQKEKRN